MCQGCLFKWGIKLLMQVYATTLTLCPPQTLELVSIIQEK